MIVLLLMEKAVQRIALPQEVESGLGYAQHEGLTCQLTDLQLALCELYEGGGV